MAGSGLPGNLVAPEHGPTLAVAAAEGAGRIVQRLQRLAALEPSALLAPSALPGWSRLTIACHLRYGAIASWRMTAEAVAGRSTSFYPGGRATERPATLHPGEGESPAAVVADLARRSSQLSDAWTTLSPEAWATRVDEPAGAEDLGGINLATLAMLRLTEVDVHGTDLDIGLDAWSEPFVTIGLPFRVRWAATRWARQPPESMLPAGGWLLQAPTGPCYRLTAGPSGATADELDAPAVSGDEVVVKGSRRDLLALLLGRAPSGEVVYAGNGELARQFNRAFPGP